MRFLLPSSSSPHSPLRQPPRSSPSASGTAVAHVRIGWGRPTPRIRPHSSLQLHLHADRSRANLAGRGHALDRGTRQLPWVRTRAAGARLRRPPRRCVQEPGRWIWTTRCRDVSLRPGDGAPRSILGVSLGLLLVVCSQDAQGGLSPRERQRDVHHGVGPQGAASAPPGPHHAKRM